jgi:hypothetical protein
MRRCGVTVALWQEADVLEAPYGAGATAGPGARRETARYFGPLPTQVTAQKSRVMIRSTHIKGVFMYYIASYPSPMVWICTCMDNLVSIDMRHGC